MGTIPFLMTVSVRSTLR